MVDYAKEFLKDTIDELKALAPLQWEEMAVGFEDFVADPNWALYMAIETRGNGLLVTAREDGKLIGYFGALIYPHLSDKNVLAASSTPYFVIKRRDRGIVLRHMIQFALKTLSERGVRLVSIRTHVWASCASILEGLDFKPVEMNYYRKLGG